MIREIDEDPDEEGAEIKRSRGYLLNTFYTIFHIGKDLLANAIEKEDFETVKDLIQNDFPVNQPLSDSDETAVHLAAKKGFLRAMPYLFSNTLLDDYNYTDVSGFSYFHAACIAGLKDAVERFIKNGVDVNSGLNADAHDTLRGKFVPLHLAAQNAHLEIVNLLLKHQADIHAIDVDGKTALHQASSIPEILADMLRRQTDDEDVTLESRRHKITAMQDESLKIIQLLIDRGCDVNVKDRRGNTPLCSVFADPSLRMKKRIFGDLKAYDRELESAFLHTSIVINEVGAKQCQKLKLLLNQGSNVDTRFGENEDTILHAAMRDLGLSRHLEDNNAAPCFLDGWHAEMIEAILNLTPIDVDTKNKAGKTPLDMAVSVLSSDVVKVLLHHDADLSGIDINSLLYPKTRLCLESVNILMDVVEARNRRGIPLSSRENLAILRSFFFHDPTEPIKFFFERDNDAYLKLQSVMEFGIDDIILKTLENIKMGNDRRMASIACMAGNAYSRKMKLCSLHVSEEVKSCMKYFPQFEFLNFDVKLSRQIEVETKRMKLMKLSKDVSLHDILNLPLDDIYSFYKNKNELNRILSPLNLRINFSFLLEIIKGFFARCLIRRFVLDVTKNNLSLITPLNEDCCEKLSKYLHIDDVQNLLMANDI